MRFGLFIVLFLAVFVARGDDTASNTRITLTQALQWVVEHDPQLAMNGYDAKIAQARIEQAKLSPPLEVRAEIQNIGATGKYSGFANAETTLSLLKTLELGGKRGLYGELAEQHAGLTAYVSDSHRLDVLAEAAQRFIHVVADQHRLQLARESFELTQAMVNVVAARVQAGRSHTAELRRANVEMTRAEIELEHTEHELATSRLKLSAAWGETTPQFSSAEAALFELPVAKPLAELESWLDKNPDLARYATEERLAQARLRLAQSKRSPNVEVSGGLRYFHGSNDAAVTISASLPLGMRAYTAAEVEENKWAAQREPLRYRQHRLALYMALFELYQEMLHARTAAEALAQRIIPEAERAARDYEDGYRSGRFSLLELTAAQHALLEARNEHISNAANFHRLQIEIERITGTTMYTGTQP